MIIVEVGEENSVYLGHRYIRLRQLLGQAITGIDKITLARHRHQTGNPCTARYRLRPTLGPKQDERDVVFRTRHYLRQWLSAA